MIFENFNEKASKIFPLIIICKEMQTEFDFFHKLYHCCDINRTRRWKIFSWLPFSQMGLTCWRIRLHPNKLFIFFGKINSNNRNICSFCFQGFLAQTFFSSSSSSFKGRSSPFNNFSGVDMQNFPSWSAGKLEMSCWWTWVAKRFSSAGKLSSIFMAKSI